ncbi:peptidoglycan-binding domain-containing protein [Rhizobium halophytocola]|uniref:Peptidoglycan binding-like domain-containing protein n=1 Tax=Rhizobium halophytocola TaxID=735519 RepID=A0ABS4E3F9_9HYPH|nr:peptidoglycan-binding domain-containing protein [Rhizobium halophytocola]MBP1852475.1 hypothetical protein [Rhizobium halophytocola]
MTARLVFMILGLILGALPAAAQQFDRVVALVVSVGTGAARADAVQTQLQLMGVETLRSVDPNNSELRSILTRFAREAANSRATVVYIDAPAVNFEGRSFVLPAGAKLDRSTDIFTQGIPINAFSRSSAQAEQGGAVVMTAVDIRSELASGLSVMKSAPEGTPGSGSVLVADVSAFGPVIANLSAAATQPQVELGALLRRLSVVDNVSISSFPANPINLREPPQQAEAAPAPVAIPQAEPQPETASEAPEAAAAPAETPEELTLLEQQLSRAAKRAIQRKLRDLGFYQGLVDGVFGPQTHDAIKAFQKGRSAEPTGLLNRRQLLELSA